MKWIFVGLLLGSVVTSEHETREACEGRAVLLREKGATGQCHSVGTSSMGWSTRGTIQLCADGRCTAQ